MNIRKCNECQQEKIRTEEFWSKNSRSADGLSYICKVCNREISKQHRLKQKIKNENIDNILNEGKKICNVCKCEKEIDDFSIERSLKSGRRNRCKECCRKKSKKYREIYYNQHQNGEIEYILDNKICKICDVEKNIKEFRFCKYFSNGYSNICKKCMLEKSLINQKIRYREDVCYKLKMRVNRSIYKVFMKKNRRSNSSCFKHLSYTVQELKDHLEKQFDENMNWQNYGSYWHIDHIYPQSLLPYDSMEHINFKICWDLKNLRPLEAKENIIKHTKTNEESEKFFLDLMNKYKGSDI